MLSSDRNHELSRSGKAQYGISILWASSAARVVVHDSQFRQVVEVASSSSQRLNH